MTGGRLEDHPIHGDTNYEGRAIEFTRSTDSRRLLVTRNYGHPAGLRSYRLSVVDARGVRVGFVPQVIGRERLDAVVAAWQRADIRWEDA